MSKFRIQITNATYLDKHRRLGRMLRFTLSLVYQHQVLGDIGVAIEGCLLRRLTTEKIAWTMPLSNFTPSRSRQLHTITPALYELVLNELLRLGYGKFCGRDFEDELCDKLPNELDPALPSGGESVIDDTLCPTLFQEKSSISPNSPETPDTP